MNLRLPATTNNMKCGGLEFLVLDGRGEPTLDEAKTAFKTAWGTIVEFLDSAYIQCFTPC